MFSAYKMPWSYVDRLVAASNLSPQELQPSIVLLAPHSQSTLLPTALPTISVKPSPVSYSSQSAN